MKIGIGIDAGGTYTDAVIYDFDTEEILSSSKALTTKDDLSIGILEALDQLPLEIAQQAEQVSLSTTLATNACVEDRGGNVKLIMLGVMAKTIDEAGRKYGLPPSKDIYLQDSFTKFSGEIEREPDWDLFRENIKTGFDGLDGVAIIELNGIRNGGVIERKAKEILLETYDYPVICAHELFGDLNVLQRGASTLLNAQLIPVIYAFLKAIKSALKQRGINASITIVRSDGSLMSEEMAYTRPVETLLSGPAASVTGSLALRDEQNYYMVDMGGTTSDISIVNNRKPVKVTDGIHIGKWRTFVDGLFIKTIGLGGDTCVHYDKTGLFLEAYRAEPMSVAAIKFPEIIDNLKELIILKRRLVSYPYEHYYLLKDIQNNPSYSEEEKALCGLLSNRPVIYKQFAEKVRRSHASERSVARLINEGVIQVVGLTPTDVMHIKGDLDRFSTEAAQLTVDFVAAELGMTNEALCDLIYDRVKRRLFKGIARAGFESKYDARRLEGLDEAIEASLDESYQEAFSKDETFNIHTRFQTDFPQIGVGAPIHIFLPDAAYALGTTAVLPEHHEVANALGAIVSNVNASTIIQVSPTDNDSPRQGFSVFGLNETKFFEELEEAEAFALELAESDARELAISRGASGEINVKTSMDRKIFMVGTVELYLGTEVEAEATGSIIL